MNYLISPASTPTIARTETSLNSRSYTRIKNYKLKTISNIKKDPFSTSSTRFYFGVIGSGSQWY